MPGPSSCSLAWWEFIWKCLGGAPGSSGGEGGKGWGDHSRDGWGSPLNAGFKDNVPSER